jgi:hypothetical protein
MPQHADFDWFPGLSRYAVCRVGEGFSVENRRTGEREGWFQTEAQAQKAAANLRAALTAGKGTE